MHSESIRPGVKHASRNIYALHLLHPLLLLTVTKELVFFYVSTWISLLFHRLPRSTFWKTRFHFKITEMCAKGRPSAEGLYLHKKKGVNNRIITNIKQNYTYIMFAKPLDCFWLAITKDTLLSVHFVLRKSSKITSTYVKYLNSGPTQYHETLIMFVRASVSFQCAYGVRPTDICSTTTSIWRFGKKFFTNDRYTNQKNISNCYSCCKFNFF